MNNALNQYQDACDNLTDDPRSLLTVLLARDHVEEVWQATTDPRTLEHAERLLLLDDQLTDHLKQLPVETHEQLSLWRYSFQPSDRAWWWGSQPFEPEVDSTTSRWEWLLVVSAPYLWLPNGIIWAIVISLTLDITGRLFHGGPDFLSVFGAVLVAALLADSPLAEFVWEQLKGAFGEVPSLKQRTYFMLMSVGTILILVLGSIRSWGLPYLAVQCNNWGFEAQDAGQLTDAQYYLKWAVTLDPTHPVPYLNLANLYHEIARPTEAETWYQQSIERQPDSVSAYRGLGALYNQQEQYQAAETTLLAGLARHDSDSMTLVTQDQTATVEQYLMLSHLGQAYFGQEQYASAQLVLEEALTLEEPIKSFEQQAGPDIQYRLAEPHYYLAQIYEQQQQYQAAYDQWGDCLRLLEEGWSTHEWRVQAKERRAVLREMLQ